MEKAGHGHATQRRLATVMPLIRWDLSWRLVCFINKEDLAFY